jgi:SET domain-containing protein
MMMNCENIKKGTDDGVIIIDDINITYIHSDNLYIEKRTSLLPIKNAGIGVFAKMNISNGTIICEYRGPIISEEYFPMLIDNDKLLDVPNSDGKEHKIIGNNICAYINDCTSALNRSYTLHDIEIINNGSMQINCFDNYNYNSKYIVTREGKAFVIAIKDIIKGEEIFSSYGW